MSLRPILLGILSSCLLRIWAEARSVEASSAYWMNAGREAVLASLNRQPNTNRARSAVLFIGDGMGLPAVASSRIYNGQTERLASEQQPLSFERFPFVGLSQTYSQNRHTTDSSASATAFLCGVKANHGTSGLGPEVERNDCIAAQKYPVDSIANWAIAEGKWVGVVTTTRITHATPASLYAHSPHRDWECDTDMIKRNVNLTAGCTDIASQLIRAAPGNQLRVIMGGGRAKFQPPHVADPEYPSQGGERSDGADLIEEWKKGEGRREYVTTKQQLQQVDTLETDYLLGLFEPQHLKYQINIRLDGDTDEPSLEEMVVAAVKMLSRNPNGYFLLVESGRIDHAQHVNQAKLMLEETKMLHKTVETVDKMTDTTDTLLITTADHSHPMSLIGYPSRNLSILDKFYDPDEPFLDNLPSTILVFANGPSAKLHNTTKGRRDLTNVDTEHVDFLQPSMVPMRYSTHAGEDVAVYAKGPWAHLLTGVNENILVAHVISFALCVGPMKRHCLDNQNKALDPQKLSTGQQEYLKSLQRQVTVLIITTILTILLAIVIIGLLLHRFCRKDKVQEATPMNTYA